MPISGGKTTPYVGRTNAIGTRYWPPASIQLTSAAAVVSQDRHFAVPFNLPGLAVDRISVETTVGGGSAKFAIYDNADGVPGYLLVDAGSVDCSGIGVAEASFPALVLPEWCWAVAIFSATPTCRCGVGNQSVLGTSGPGNQIRGLISSGTPGYANGMPTSMPGMSFLSSCPAIFLRKS